METQKRTEVAPVVKKELKYKQLPIGIYILYWEGGGELPQELSGYFTHIHMIERAVDNYYRKKMTVSKAKKEE